MKKLLKFIINGILFVILLFGALIYFDSKKDAEFEKQYQAFAEGYIRQYNDDTVPISSLVDHLNDEKLDKIDSDSLKAIRTHLTKLGDIKSLKKVEYDGVTYSNKGNKGLFVYKANYATSVLLFKVEVIEKDSGPQINNFFVKEVTGNQSYDVDQKGSGVVNF